MDEDRTFPSDVDSIAGDNDKSTDAEDEEEKVEGNPGLADALAKVIRLSKNTKGKSLVLSKAKLYSPDEIINKKKTIDFEIEPDSNVQVKIENDESVKCETNYIKEDKKFIKKGVLKKKEKHRGRLKPSVLDREKEKPLVKIATRGVVQLFNAVKQQQSAIEKEVNRPGVTEGKKEKLLKSINKKTFLEVLRGNKCTGSVPQDIESEIKDEPDDENEGEPSWQVLRDDFMMGAKLKDWDKKEIEVEE